MTRRCDVVVVWAVDSCIVVGACELVVAAVVVLAAVDAVVVGVVVAPAAVVVAAAVVVVVAVVEMPGAVVVGGASANAAPTPLANRRSAPSAAGTRLRSSGGLMPKESRRHPDQRRVQGNCGRPFR
jgi:hypothetical protein